jgi:hypothetical protein
MGRLTPVCCAAALAISLLCSGCITISGTSDRQLRNAALASPLINLSDKYYPSDGPQTKGGVAVNLSPEQVREIRATLLTLLKAVKQTHRHYFRYLQEEMGSPMPIDLPIDLEIDPGTSSTAEIRTDNTIYLDLGVLQGFFKGAILDVSERSFFDLSPAKSTSPNESSRDENAIVQNFLQFKRDLRNSKGRTVVGEVFGGQAATDESERLETMWESMTTATARYLGLLLFTLSHEAGHYALGHLKEKCEPTECNRFVERELAADRYATALLAALVPQEPVFGFDFQGNAESLRGYEPFFTIGYEFARFSNTSICSCEYPLKERRLELSEAELLRATKRLNAEGWIKWKYNTPRRSRTSDFDVPRFQDR